MIPPPSATADLAPPATGDGWVDAIIESGSLQIVYQPILELHSHRLVGYEALSRFAAEPKQPPNVWFEQAGREGRRLELELHAIRLAVSGMENLPASAFLSINASPSTVIAPELCGVLAGVPLHRLVLEVTEQEPIEAYDVFAKAIGPLRTAGLRLALDDVGAGFASLTHIIRLEPDVLKLDRALTSEVGASSHVRALAAALTSFALEIQATVLAEGIETEEQLALLIALGVPLGQGFLLGRPAPAPPAGA